MSIVSLLRKIGLFSRPLISEIEAAEDEYVERATIENSEAVRKYEASTAQSVECSSRLRETIRSRTSAFSDLEHGIGGHSGQHN